jgi:putative N6-adenine-specific DNA methylase
MDFPIMAKTEQRGLHETENRGFEYQTWNRYFAQLPGKMEELGAEELAELEALNIRPSFKGAFFEADKATLYRINYQSRLASRILAPLLTFKCHSTKYLYRTAKAVDWSRLLTPERTFAVSATVAQSKIRHSKYAALCLKDAIADYFRENTGRRPDVRPRDPDVQFNLHVQNDKAVISLDTSGSPLHQRGYRKETVEAPMRETLAAAIIRLTGWNGETPLCDPMCGSGTLLCEALMRACRIPSGFLRKRFGFEALPDFDRELWVKIKQEVDARIRVLPRNILFGKDISRRVLDAAKANSRVLPSGENIHWEAAPIENITIPTGCSIVCNPPYGVRLGERKDVAALYRRMGQALRLRCGGSTAFIYIGDPSLIKEIGIKPSMKRPMLNGAIEGRLCRFRIFPSRRPADPGSPVRPTPERG